MTESTLTPDQCNAHAKACRDMARKETNPDTRKSLEDLAASWEQLCEEIGKIKQKDKR